MCEQISVCVCVEESTRVSYTCVAAHFMTATLNAICFTVNIKQRLIVLLQLLLSALSCE